MSGSGALHGLDTPAAACRIHRVGVVAIAASQPKPELLDELNRESEVTASSWHPGPLPLGLERDGTPRGTRTVVADRRSRASYLSSASARLVLGEDGGEQARRYWRRLGPGDAVPIDGVSIWAAEVLQMPALEDDGSDTAISVILHASVDATGLDLRGVLGRIRAVTTDCVRGSSLVAHLEPDRVKGRPDVYRISMLTLEEGEPTAVFPAVRSDCERDQWLFAIASTTLPGPEEGGGTDTRFNVGEFVADDDYLKRQINDRSLLVPSADWRMLILRDGAAVLGLRPDTGFSSTPSPWSRGNTARGTGDYFDSLEQYVRTIFTDPILLGLMQRRVLGDLSERALRHVSAPDTDPRRTRDLGARVGWFREQLWWQDVSASGESNEILAAYQHQHGLASRLEQVTKDVADHARRVQTESSLRTNGALAAITAFGLPIGAAVTSATLVVPSGTSASDRWIYFGVALAAALTASVVLVSTLRGLRDSLRDAFWTHSKRLP